MNKPNPAVIEPIDAGAFTGYLGALGALLHACVHDGANIGFVLPFSRGDAEAVWREAVLPDLLSGARLMLIARCDGAIAGTAQLGLATPANQTHRADVVKMMVQPDYRRRGIARALILELEVLARRQGCRLLTLDTVTGEKAEPLYTALGYQTAGIIPAYCRDPREDRIAAVLGEIGASVVLVQEADKRLGERSGRLSADELRRACGLCMVPVSGDGASHAFHGNALLVGESVAVERLEPLDLPSLEPCGAILAEVSDTDGRRLRLVGAHLGLRGADRRRQVESIRAALERCDTTMPVVVLGDFNEWFSPGGSLASLRARFSSTALGVTFHTSAPVAPLDRIFVSSEIAVRAAGVHRSPTAQRASDHLPVWADLELGAAP